MNKEEMMERAKVYKLVSDSNLSIEELVNLELEARAIFADKQALKWSQTAIKMAYDNKGLENFAYAIETKQNWIKEAKELRALKGY